MQVEVTTMKKKSIVFTKAFQAELLEETYRSPGPGEVLVQMAYSTISSGTERANLVGDVNISIGPKTSDVAVFPRRCGYSSSGIVVQVGEGVKDYTPGDRVAMFGSVHTQFICIPADNICRLPDIVSLQEAALWYISAFPLGAIRKCRLEVGESAVVMGQGILGMMAVKLLRVSGAAPIIAVDPVAEKRDHALSIGADYALDPFDPEFADKVKKITGGGAKVAIEVTGNGKALDMVLDCMARFGRVALLGCTRDSDFTIDYYRKVHGPGITLVGAHNNARPNESYPGMWSIGDDMDTICNLVSMGRLEFESLIQEVHSPENCQKVYQRLANEKAFPVVQFDWGKLI